MGAQALADLDSQEGREAFMREVEERYRNDPAFHARCYQVMQMMRGKTSDAAWVEVMGAIVTTLHLDDVVADRWRRPGG